MHACYLLIGHSVMLLLSAELAGRVLCSASLRGVSTEVPGSGIEESLLQDSACCGH